MRASEHVNSKILNGESPNRTNIFSLQLQGEAQIEDLKEEIILYSS